MPPIKALMSRPKTCSRFPTSKFHARYGSGSPNLLAGGVCMVTIKAHNQISNTGPSESFLRHAGLSVAT